MQAVLMTPAEGRYGQWQSSREGVVAQSEGEVLYVTLNRPDVHNALNDSLLEELKRVITVAGADDGPRVIVITGAGPKAFSAGADLDEMTGLEHEAAREVLLHGQEVFRCIEQSSVPTIAAVNGFAIGGGFELALACAFILAADCASFSLPESGLGLIPGYGGTQRLPRLIGRQAALHVMLTGERLSAQRAYDLGLVSMAPVSSEELAGLASSTAAKIAARGRESSRRIVAAVNRGRDLPLEAALELEAVLAGDALVSAEGREGIQAFKERRSPRFGGNDR
jgi:enoyl-CoA hydratase